MPTPIVTADFANPELPPLPAATFVAPREYTVRTSDGVSVHRIRTAEESMRFRALLINDLKAQNQAKVAALEADNLDAYNAALGQEMALATVIMNMESTGNTQRPEQDGLWVAGWAVCQAKEQFPPECIGLKIDPDEVRARCQRVRLLSNTIAAVDEFRAQADDALAAEERELATVVRLAHAKLEGQYDNSLGLRRLGRFIVDYCTGAAKLAAEQARKNKKLVESTKAGIMNQLKERLDAPAAPPAAPAASPPSAPAPRITRT